MDVLSTESLEKLRSSCMKNPDVIHQEFEELEDELNLTTVPFNAEIANFPSLEIPEGISQETNKDLENCKILAEAFSGLIAAKATDERLWATLCFKNYSSYARARWPLDRAKTQENHVQDHWFAKTSRNRMRDNAVSRLWWMAHIASRVDRPNDEVLKTLFFNSDYRSNLLERNSSANAINVVASILSISQKYFDDGVEFNREKFRTFMKQVDFVGKRTALPSLTAEDLEALLTPIYASAYEIKTKKKVEKKKASNATGKTKKST